MTLNYFDECSTCNGPDHSHNDEGFCLDRFCMCNKLRKEMAREIYEAEVFEEYYHGL